MRQANSKVLFDKAAAMAEQDIRRRYADSIYTLEKYAHGWILRADGVAICAPFKTKESGLVALDSVAPIA